ncbi:hypothetical protein [Halalkalibacter urbisdiaboli]|uniref:hypothetical protein n=1 Tax=Halalkalibacter urbisdiaboli TaxID=1960589 RepID=UPI000B44AC97|nr:hypothetical protein [Halalkalibacter urbisdiaboli]
MSEEKQQQPQPDFFTDLMFGSQARQRAVSDSGQGQTEPSSRPDEVASTTGEKPNETEQTQVIPDKQVEQLLMLVQTLGPTIEKLAPLAGVIQTFFKNFSKKGETETKKGANKS